MNQVEAADPSSWSNVDKSGYIAKEALADKYYMPKKRKNSNLGSKSKRLRIENDDLIELKVTWEEAQGLLRPPANHVPTVVVIEGFEFEEYEVHGSLLFLFQKDSRCPVLLMFFACSFALMCLFIPFHHNCSINLFSNRLQLLLCPIKMM